eukprot:m.34724 g.34724  ORF g.34724 m.34724 type:complete len:322 (+) comp11191_c0_seq1:552-1517(+)
MKDKRHLRMSCVGGCVRMPRAHASQPCRGSPAIVVVVAAEARVHIRPVRRREGRPGAGPVVAVAIGLLEVVLLRNGGGASCAAGGTCSATCSAVGGGGGGPCAAALVGMAVRSPAGVDVVGARVRRVRHPAGVAAGAVIDPGPLAVGVHLLFHLLRLALLATVGVAVGLGVLLDGLVALVVGVDICDGVGVEDVGLHRALAVVVGRGPVARPSVAPVLNDCPGGGHRHNGQLLGLLHQPGARLLDDLGLLHHGLRPGCLPDTAERHERRCEGQQGDQSQRQKDGNEEDEDGVAVARRRSDDDRRCVFGRGPPCGGGCASCS